MRLPCLLLLGVCLAACAAGSAWACPDSKSAAKLTPSTPTSARRLVAWRPRAWSPSTRAALAAQGLRVSIDPVDGAYGMPPVDETTQIVSTDPDRPVAITRRANGTVRAQLDDRFAEFAVVSIGADGKPHWTCVHGASGASKFMSVPTVTAPAKPVWEEK